MLVLKHRDLPFPTAPTVLPTVFVTPESAPPTVEPALSRIPFPDS